MERQKYRPIPMILSIAFILCSVFSMLALCPIKAYAAGAVTVENANSITCIFANGNPITLKAGATSDKTLIYLNSNTANPIELTGLTGDTTDGYDLSAIYIYGGSNTDAVVGNTSITMLGGKVANVLGSGYKGTVGSTTVNISGGTVMNGVYGGGAEDAATVFGNTVVNVSGGTVSGNVYGGGRYGNVSGSTTTNISGGTVNNVLGGGFFGTVGSTTVNITGGTLVMTSVYGGGSEEPAKVTGTTVVTVSGGTITTNVYGGGILGDVDSTVIVRIGAEASIAPSAVTASGRNTAKAAVGSGSHVEYEVAFYDGATKLASPAPQWVTAGGTVTQPASDPVSAGKGFTGWKKAPGGSAFDFSAAITAPAKVYADWIPLTYAVTYNGNGSTSGTVPTDSKTYVTGAAVTLAGNTGNLAKSGYTFEGWSTTAGGTAVTSYSMGTGPVTFFAVWKAAPTGDNSNNNNASNNNSYNDTTSRAPTLETSNGNGQTISDALQAAQNGSSVNINMNDSTMLQSDWLKAIAGKDVTLVLNMRNGVKWIINGKSVTATNFSNLNLNIFFNSNSIPGSVLNNLTGERKSIQFTISHSGNFGFTATLSTNLGKENAGLFGNLFYYNETTKKMEFQSASPIGEDGSAAWDLNHTSSYAVVIDKVSLAGTELSAGAGAVDNAVSTHKNTAKWSISGITGIFAGAGVLFLIATKKRRVK